MAYLWLDVTALCYSECSRVICRRYRRRSFALLRMTCVCFALGCKSDVVCGFRVLSRLEGFEVLLGEDIWSMLGLRRGRVGI